MLGWNWCNMVIPIGIALVFAAPASTRKNGANRAKETVAGTAKNNVANAAQIASSCVALANSKRSVVRLARATAVGIATNAAEGIDLNAGSAVCVALPTKSRKTAFEFSVACPRAEAAASCRSKVEEPPEARALWSASVPKRGCSLRAVHKLS